MKCLNFSLAAVAAVAIAFAASQASAQNLLSNAGFEGPPIASGPAPFTGRWEPFSGDNFASGNINSFTSTLMPLSGSQHLEMSIIGVANTFAGAFQDVTGLNAGQILTWSGWSKDLGIDAGGSEIRIEWRNFAGDNEISRTGNLVPTLSNQYTQWSVTDTVPAGADTARVVYAIQSFGAGPDQLILVDDTSVTVVPEPASLALMGFAGLAIVAMRRRK